MSNGPQPPANLDPDVAELLEASRAAKANAYAPYSRFQVGAALRDEQGRVWAGANVENVAFPQGQCAEASALGTLVTQGGRRVVAVLVLGQGPGLLPPCGGCRQRLAEFADPDTPVHLHACGAEPVTVSLSSLLPRAFGPGDLVRERS